MDGPEPVLNREQCHCNLTEEDTMTTMSHTATCKSRTTFLALAVGATLLFTSGVSMAEPKQGTSCSATGKEKGLNACADSPGHTIVCTSNGDYMCCVNTPTGKECEEITKDSEMGNVGKFQRNQLQLTPMNP